jgi:hypothetical protein
VDRNGLRQRELPAGGRIKSIKSNNDLRDIKAFRGNKDINGNKEIRKCTLCNFGENSILVGVMDMRTVGGRICNGFAQEG